MNKLFKWLSAGTVALAVPFVVLLAYEQHWVSAATWVILGITGWVNYKNMLSLIEYEDVVNAKLDEMIDDMKLNGVIDDNRS